MTPRPAASRSAEAVRAEAAAWVARRDRGLSAGEQAEFQQWLEADPRHQAALAFYDNAWSVLAEPAHRGLGGKLESQVGNLRRRRNRRRTVAAGLALVLGAALWLAPFSRRADGPAESALVQLPARQVLADGSVVELKGAARITVDFTPTARHIRLEAGEAHFEVRKDPSRPFIVSAEGIDVRAVGTAFTVQRGQAAVEVLVTHGIVALDRSEAGRPEPVAAPLDAGKLAVVNLAPDAPAAAVRALDDAEMNERLAWRSARLEFTKTPLAEAVDLFNRYKPAAAARLELADPALAGVRVTGVFRADNVEAFVLLLEGAFDVKADRAPGLTRLRKAAN